MTKTALIPDMPTSNNNMPEKPDREEALEAVRTLLRWAGEDVTREGLLDTPDRVLRAYEEFFGGYREDPAAILGKTFEDITGYHDIVLVRNIRFVSHCEHHMVPIIGKAHVAYWPDARVVGISKLARIVDVFGKRLISQENMTRQIGEALEENLKPKGVAVLVSAAHQCMSTRGVNKSDSTTVTSYFTGLFRDDAAERQRFMDMVRLPEDG